MQITGAWCLLSYNSIGVALKTQLLKILLKTQTENQSLQSQFLYKKVRGQLQFV
jgi:hypothetical protein